MQDLINTFWNASAADFILYAIIAAVVIAAVFGEIASEVRGR